MDPKVFEAVKAFLNVSASNTSGALGKVCGIPDPNTDEKEFLQIMGGSPVLALEGLGSNNRVVEVISGSVHYELDNMGLVQKVRFKGKSYKPNGSLIETPLDAWGGICEDCFTLDDLRYGRVYCIPRSLD